MLNPNELLESGRERQRTLIAWRQNRTRLNRLPPLERAAHTALRRVMTAIICKLKSLRPVRAAAPTGATRRRRSLS